MVKPRMTAALEQTQSDLLALVRVAQQGGEVIITSQGRPGVRLSGLPTAREPSDDRQVWPGRLRRLRERTATGKTGLTVEQMLDEDRGD